MAASKFDLTDELYDLIIPVSLQKPAWKCRPYWPGPARHYRVAVMTRVSQQATSARAIARALMAQIQGSTVGAIRSPI